MLFEFEENHVAVAACDQTVDGGGEITRMPALI